MKKIININLSGRVIPIEDSAYESLQRYIESLRRYFANEEGRDEIINDIESRVAELMNEKIRKGAAAVTDSDIEEIINSMGRVEDFEQAEATEPSTASSAQSSDGYTYAEPGTKRFKGRLYRDAADKMIGGVCAGIANYMNVDPAIIRLLFAIITFGGFGMGFLLYILLWIILPARDLDTYVGKRLFRNPEDRMIGGVAGGLAAYFNKSSKMIRLIFAAPLIINIFFGILNGVFSPFDWNPIPNVFFGSLTSTFILIYIVLWIVLPEARSSFEKMEMRGEKVDVNSIRQNVQEEMNQFRTRAQAWGEEVKTSAEQFGQRARVWADTRSKTFAAEASQAVRPVANTAGHIIGVLFKAFFLFIAGTIAFALFVAVLVFTISGVAQPFKDFLIDGFWQNLSLWGVLIFFLAIPLIALITWVVRRMMRVRSQNRYLGWIFSGLWLLGFISLGIFISSMVRDFRYYNRVSQPVTLAQPASNKLNVRIDEPEIRYSGTFSWIDEDEDGGFDITEDSLRMANVKLRVTKSTDSLYHATIWRYSAGKNRREAASRAEKVVFSASSLDSSLLLGSGLGISKNEKFRGQKIVVEIRVPVGKTIRFDETVEGKLHPVNVRVSDRRRWDRNDWDMDWDEDYYFNWKSNVDYTMNADGELIEAGTSTPTAPSENGVYEYRKNSSADSLKKAIEERERQLEQDRQRLREVEESNTLKQKRRQEGTAQVMVPTLSIII